MFVYLLAKLIKCKIRLTCFFSKEGTFTSNTSGYAETERDEKPEDQRDKNVPNYSRDWLLHGVPYDSSTRCQP